MWTAIAIIGSIVASTVVGIVAQSMQNKSQRETNQANKEINKTNNAFSAEQADINRQFQAAEAQTDRTYSAEQADINRQFNAEQAQINREFQAAEAQKARDYETEMSNTAIQRRVADLQASGFNPMLAITSGASSTPGAVGVSGSTASGQAASGAHASGSQASASGFMPMKAMDYSPMAQMSSNLSHMVSSAASIIRLEKMAKSNPQTMAYLARASKGLMQSTTGAGKIDKLYSALKGTYGDAHAKYMMDSYDAW